MTHSQETDSIVSDWRLEAGIAITVCDLEGTIVEMNHESVRSFAKYGGEALLGQNLLDCHSGNAREKLKSMLQRPTTNTYIIRREDGSRLIHQFPWMRDGKPAGLVEFGFPVPDAIPGTLKDPQKA